MKDHAETSFVPLDRPGHRDLEIQEAPEHARGGQRCRYIVYHPDLASK
jgi:hypothetical protein